MDVIEGFAEILMGRRPHLRDWAGDGLQTLVIVFVLAVVWGLTRKLVQRLHFLGKFLKLCAWCRKVGHQGKWMKLEDYYAEDFHIPTTHGMCPECRRMMEEETAEFVREQRGAATKELTGLKKLNEVGSG